MIFGVGLQNIIMNINLLSLVHLLNGNMSHKKQSGNSTVTMTELFETVREGESGGTRGAGGTAWPQPRGPCPPPRTHSGSVAARGISSWAFPETKTAASEVGRETVSVQSRRQVPELGSTADLRQMP